MNNNSSQMVMRLKVLALHLCFACLGLSKGIGNVAAVSLLILSLISLDYSVFKRNFLDLKHVWSLGIMFVVIAISLLYSDEIKPGIEILRQNNRLVFLPLLLILNVDIIRKYYKSVLFAFIITTSVGALFTSILNYMDEDAVITITKATPFLQEYVKHNNRASFGLYSPFYDRIQYSNIIGLAVICCMYLITQKYKRKWLIPSIIILIYTSMLLGGRGGQLALLGALFVYLSVLFYNVWSPKLIQKWGRPLTITIATSTFIFLFLVSPFLIYQYNDNVKKRYSQMKWELETFYSTDTKNDAYVHFTSVRRLVSWSNTWEIIKKHPVIGVGAGDYNKALKTAYDSDGYDFPENTHSQYLYFWAMTGLIGLTVFLGIIIFWLNYLKACSKEFMLGIGFIAFYGFTMIPDAVLIKQIDNMAFSLFFAFIGIIGSFYRLKK